MSKCKTAACCVAAFASFRTCGPRSPVGRSNTSSKKSTPVGRQRLSRSHFLTGIHLGHYGVERNRAAAEGTSWTRLSHLLERLAALPGDFRVRLSSIEATEVTRELLGVMAGFPERICPHLHVSLQSGSDTVLRRMHRRWGAKRFVDRCKLAGEMLDRPAFTTDIIVGFPGETEADFDATCEVAREVGFSKIHIFPFSRRPGTPAFDMRGSGAAGDQGRTGANGWRSWKSSCASGIFGALRGRRLRVLVESPIPDRPGFMHGTACRYAPVCSSCRAICRCGGSLSK